MSYTRASTTYENAACTNVPIHCPLCPPDSPDEPATIWKYNTVPHLCIAHIDEEGNAPDIPAQLLIDMHVSKQEEKWMGIEEALTETWREENMIPDSDGIEFEEARAEANLKRDRALSMADAEHRAKQSRHTR